MSKIVRLLGSIILAGLMYSVPVLSALSFGYRWDSFVKYILVLTAIGQFVCLVMEVYFKTEE